MHAIRGIDLAFAPSRRGSLWGWLVACGTLLATLDLAFAAVFWWLRSGVDPIRMPQLVASWVLGREAALSGGLATALLGMALYSHLTTAVVAVYHGLAREAPRLRERPLTMGALYGVTVYVLLFHAAVPAWSAAAPRPQPMAWTVACLIAYPMLVGIPTALLVRHRLGRRR